MLMLSRDLPDLDRPTKARPAEELANAPLLLLSANSAWNIWNFRLNLVRALQTAGYRIAVAAPADERAPALSEAGVHFVDLPMRPSGLSPLQDAALIARYVRLMRELRPAAYLGFTAKPNVYGSMAAQRCGVPVVNNLTGLGTTFIHGGVIERLMSLLYRRALRRSAAIFFHNPDDRDLFVKRKLVAGDRAAVIPGSGIDLAEFEAQPVTGNDDRPVFLFVGRLLWEKGVAEFIEAARAVKRAHPGARFQLAGALATGGRAVPCSQVQQWEAEGLVEYLGPVSEIRARIAHSHCVVLPSWREGLPRVLLEAAAMGRPSVASDAPGCRHAVVDGVTGYVSKARSSHSLADCITRMIELPAHERRAMGVRARAHAEEHFGVERISAAYLTVLDRIGVRNA